MLAVVCLLLAFIAGGSTVVGVMVFLDYWQWAGSHGPFSRWADRRRARASIEEQYEREMGPL